jgi:hypothetical protein
MAIAKDGKVYIGQGSTPGQSVGTYEILTLSENPMKVQVKGNYDTSLAPKGGGGDALHSFENRKKDDFGGAMNSVVNMALKQVYNKRVNPYVASISIDMPPKGQGPKVFYEVVITESPDGIAWVGLSSRGGAGGKSGPSGAFNRAANQTKDKKASLPGEVGEPGMQFRDVLDYQNEKVYIRQIFFNYTKPNGSPNLPKTGTPPAVATVSAGEGPVVTTTTDVTAGITGSTVSGSASIISASPSIPLNVVFPDKFEVKAREDVPPFTIWVGDIQPYEPVDGFVTLFDDTQQMDENGNLVGVESEYEEVEYFGSQEYLEVAELNEVSDEPINNTSNTGTGTTTDSGTGTTTDSGVVSNVTVDKSSVGPGPPAGSKLLTGSGKSWFIVNSSKGIAGHRLQNILPDLQKHLRANGYPKATIGSAGIMRDLVASTYPNNPLRAVASLHGAGLAIDVTFSIPGYKWYSIYDNGNLAKDSALTKVIWNFVKNQGDITWGAEWGKSKPWDGIMKGRGIDEYHHFEIKSSQIAQYWKPFEKDLKEMGFDYKKLNTVGDKGTIYKLNKQLLNSKGIA